MSVEATLAGYAELVREELPRHLPDGEPDYLYALLRDYPGRHGKGIRPALLLATCQAYGGTPREALGPAVALELLHNAFLIHDDVQDASERRRGAPTLHALHGVPLAINAGDALASLALRPVLDHRRIGARTSRRVLRELVETIRHTTEGQALELGWRRDNVIDLGPSDYLSMVAKKTCAYTTVAPLRIGALVGSRGTASLGALARFGFYLGAAFQIRDDLINLLEAGHGKDSLGDIREGKRTLMLLHLLSTAGVPEQRWLIAYLGSPEASREAADVLAIRRAMDASGSIAFAQAYADHVARTAAAAFEEAFAEVPASPHLDFVRALVPYMLARTS